MRESSEHYELMMMQELQGLQNRYEGRMEENERRVAQVIGSEARDALRGQRSHMLHEHSRRKRNIVREKSDALGLTVTHCKVSKIITCSRIST